MLASNNERNTSAGKSYGEHVNEAPGGNIRMLARGNVQLTTGEGNAFKVMPVSIYGQPQDVLFTVSLARGGVGPWIQNSVNNGTTYAVVRKPYDSAAPTNLVQLTREEVLQGSGDVNTQERAMTRIPGQGEEPLRFTVPVSEDPHQMPASLAFQMGANPNELHFGRQGPPQGHAVIVANI